MARTSSMSFEWRPCDICVAFGAGGQLEGYRNPFLIPLGAYFRRTETLPVMGPWLVGLAVPAWGFGPRIAWWKTDPSFR